MAQCRVLEQEHFARYLGGAISFEDQRRARLSGFLHYVRRSALPGHELDWLFATYLVHYEASWCAYEDAAPALLVMQPAGVALGVLTDGQEAQQLAKLAAVNLLATFDCVVASSSLTAAKPNRAAFEVACERIGCLPSECSTSGTTFRRMPWQ